MTTQTLQLQIKIADLGELGLIKQTKTELAPMAKEAGIKGFSKLKKEDLIQSLLDFAQPVIAKNLENQANVLATSIPVDVVSQTSLALAYEAGKDPVAYAQFLFAYCLKNYTAGTVVNKKRQQIKTWCQILIETRMISETWGKAVVLTFCKAGSSIKGELNALEKKKATTREGSEYITVDTDSIRSFCEVVLEEPDKFTWHRISIALAATSGRRASEIHGTCRFELDGEKVKAIGLTKKATNDAEFSFKPLWVTSEQWLDAYNKLPAERVNQTNAIVDGRIRKLIMDSCGSLLNSWNLKSYHWLRSFYICYRVDTEHDRRLHGSEPKFVSEIIGHDNQDAGAFYNKLNTKPPL